MGKISCKDTLRLGMLHTAFIDILESAIKEDGGEKPTLRWRGVEEAPGVKASSNVLLVRQYCQCIRGVKGIIEGSRDCESE